MTIDWTLVAYLLYLLGIVVFGIMVFGIMVLHDDWEPYDEGDDE